MIGLWSLVFTIFWVWIPNGNVMNLSASMSTFIGFAAVCYFVLGLRLIGGKREIGSLPLGAAFLVISCWVFGGAVEMTATSLTTLTVGSLGHYVGTALLPVLILLCFREFTGKVTIKRTTIELLIIPILSIIIAVTNYWHEFMWRIPAINSVGDFVTRPAEFGPWFKYVHRPYSFAVLGASILALITHSSAVGMAQRRGFLLLAGCTTVPLMGVVAYDIGVGPSTFATSPLALALLLPIYAWFILGQRIIECTPLAYETVFQNMQDPVIVVDDEERIISLNHSAEALLNMDEADALRKSLDKVFGDEATEVHTAIDKGEPQKMLTHSGRFLHVQVTPIRAKNAAARSANVVMFRDVSDVENAQREVVNNDKLLRTLIDHSVNGIIRLRWMIDNEPGATKELRCIFANAAAGRYLRCNPEKIVGRNVSDLLKLAATGMEPQESVALSKRFIDAAQRGDMVDTETRIESDEDTKWLRIISEPMGEDVAMTFVDVTDRKAKEEKMESIASSDPLTGVLNRRGFEREAAQRLTNSSDDARGALMFIDLNDFKKINDKYGHAAGDRLLKISVERLQQSLRLNDIIGRLGGDEFVVLVPDVDPQVAEKLAIRLTSTLEQPYRIVGKDLICAASIGLALYPEHANTLTGLMRAADAAMYRAKARCRDCTDLSDVNLLEKAG